MKFSCTGWCVIIESDYEIERGKLIPSKNHGIIQGNIYFNFRVKYADTYEIVPELSVIINDREKVPDLAIFRDIEYTPGRDEVKVLDIPLGVIEILSPKQSLAD